jgi:hypothetical protein
LGPDDVAEVRRIEAAYAAGLTGSSHHLIANIFGTLAVAFPAQRIGEDEAAAKLALYCRSLSDVPTDALQRAVDHLLKTQNWFPTVAEIRQAAAPHFEPRRMAMFACRSLIMRHDRDYRPPVEEKTDWTQDEVDEANRSFARMGLKTRYRLDPDRPGQICTDDARATLEEK